MQTKLRIGGLMFVASLLWTSPMSAAPLKAKAHRPTQSPKIRYLGIASWYGKQHQGRKMANGQRFERHKLTAASWYFPLGTTIRVVNVTSGASVVVTITDRGPNLRLHRILDLSEAAAQQLDYIEQGVIPVFLYPMVSIETESVEIDSHLMEPHFSNVPVDLAGMILSAIRVFVSCG